MCILFGLDELLVLALVSAFGWCVRKFRRRRKVDANMEDEF